MLKFDLKKLKQILDERGVNINELAVAVFPYRVAPQLSLRKALTAQTELRVEHLERIINFLELSIDQIPSLFTEESIGDPELQKKLSSKLSGSINNETISFTFLGVQCYYNPKTKLTSIVYEDKTIGENFLTDPDTSLSAYIKGLKILVAQLKELADEDVKLLLKEPLKSTYKTNRNYEN